MGVKSLGKIGKNEIFWKISLNFNDFVYFLATFSIFTYFLWFLKVSRGGGEVMRQFGHFKKKILWFL